MKKPRALIRSALALLLVGACFPPALSLADGGKLVDLFVRGGEDRVRLFFKVEGTRRYSASPAGRDKLVVAFPEASASPKAVERAAHLKGVALESGKSSKSGIRSVVLLPGTLRELRSRWLGKDGILMMEAYWTPAARPFSHKNDSSLTLAALRFGPEPHYTRLVMAFSGKPSWKLDHVKGGDIRVHLNSVNKGIPRRTRYGPVGLLAGITLSRGTYPGGLSLAVRGGWVRERIFWLSEGNRLVMDFYDYLEKDFHAGVLPGDFGKEGPPRAAVPARAPERAGVKPVPPEAGEPGLSILAPPRAEASEVPPPAMTSKAVRTGRPYVRQRIPRPEAGGRMQARKTPMGVGHGDSGSATGGHDSSGVKSKKPAGPNPALPAGASGEEIELHGEILKARDLGDVDRAVSLIDRFVARFPSSPLVEKLLFLKGDLYFSVLQRGRKELLHKVVSSYQKAAARFKQSARVPEAYIRMARANRLAGDIYAALGYVNVVIERFPKGPYTPRAFVERAWIHMMRRAVDTASEDFMLVLREYPESPSAEEAKLGIARYFHEKGMYLEAEKRLEALEKADPRIGEKNPYYFYLKANTLLYLKRYAEARTCYYKALNLGIRAEAADMLLAHIGDTYLQQKRKEEAKKLFEFVASEFPETEGAKVARLRLAEMSSKVDGFRKLYEENRDKPIGQIAVLKIADAYYRQGQYRKAMQSLLPLVTSPVGSQIRTAAKALFSKAASREIARHYEHKEDQALVDLFQRHRDLLRTEISPGTRLKIALSLSRLGRYEEAVAHFGAVEPLELVPAERGPYFLGLARAYLALGTPEKAASILEKNLSRAPDPKQRIRMMLLLADTYRETDMHEKALALYGRLARHKRLLSAGQKAEVYFYTGKILNRLGRYEEARGFLNRAIALWEKGKEGKERFPLALEALAAGYYKEKKYGRAASVLEEAFESGLKPGAAGYWDLKYRLAKAYISMGRADRAESVLVEISEEGPPELQARVQMTLGAIRLEKALGNLSGWKDWREG